MDLTRQDIVIFYCETVESQEVMMLSFDIETGVLVICLFVFFGAHQAYVVYFEYIKLWGFVCAVCSNHNI